MPHAAPHTARRGAPLFLWVRLAAAVLLLDTLGLAAAQVKLAPTARVDTSQANTKATFQLLSGNSNQDSLHASPF